MRWLPQEKCLTCEVLGDNVVSIPFSLKLSECFGVLPPAPLPNGGLNPCGCSAVSLSGAV